MAQTKPARYLSAQARFFWSCGAEKPERNPVSRAPQPYFGKVKMALSSVLMCILLLLFAGSPTLGFTCPVWRRIQFVPSDIQPGILNPNTTMMTQNSLRARYRVKVCQFTAGAMYRSLIFHIL